MSINRLIPLFERLLSLLVVFLLLSGTVIWSGKYLGHRLAGVAAQESVETAVPLPTAEQLQMIGLSPAALRVADSASWTVVGTDGKDAGQLIATEPYAHDISGYAGPTPLYIYVDAAQVVRGVLSADNSETPDFYRRAEQDVFRQVVGMSLGDVASRKVDAVSGATFSSNAIIHNLKYAIAARSQAAIAQQGHTPAIGWGRTLAVVAVLAVGIVAAFRWRGKKKVRLLVLFLNVVVTGFWCGQFLSLSLVRGWVQNGLDPLLYLPSVLLLLVAIVMPYLHRPHHYCQWVCPYGSLQEIAWALPLPKWHVAPSVFRVMRLVRYAVLLLLLAALWFGLGVGILDYEPFAAFNVSTALTAVIVLALAFVVLGVFIPRPWCRCLCPVGTLLELCEDAGRKKAVTKQPAASPKSSPTSSTETLNPSSYEQV